MRRRRVPDWVLDVGGALLILAVIVAAALWGYQENQTVNSLKATVQSIQQVQQTNAPKVKASARNSALSAEASRQALAVVNEIPQFEAALAAGQGNLNAHLAWIECAMEYGAANCGPPPAIQPPTVMPVAPPRPPAATHPTPAPHVAPPPTPTTTTPSKHGRGKGKG